MMAVKEVSRVSKVVHSVVTENNKFLVLERQVVFLLLEYDI
jgi:hypothetical protein